jgi:hypothetical protein
LTIYLLAFPKSSENWTIFWVIWYLFGAVGVGHVMSRLPVVACGCLALPGEDWKPTSPKPWCRFLRVLNPSIQFPATRAPDGISKDISSWSCHQLLFAQEDSYIQDLNSPSHVHSSSDFPTENPGQYQMPPHV